MIDLDYDDYLALSPDKQADLKDVGFMVGGHFSGEKRLQAEMTRRSVITLDIDHIDSYDLGQIKEAYGDYHYAVHSTAKHCEDTPRLRLVLPLAKDIRPEDYEPVARRVASWAYMDMFDDTTFQPARIMYWPSCTIDGIPFSHINDGEYIDADAILESYDDSSDFSEWPHSRRVTKIRKPVKQAEDPLHKSGIIGAFCRAFDVHSAIAEFELPYEPTDYDNRYRPEGSTGASGAIVYDDVFLYSHHESDVAAQLNLNAFDLVRYHRFNEMVTAESDDMPMGDRPSFRAMQNLAVQYPAVIREARTSSDEMEVIESGEQQVNGEDQTPTPTLTELLETAKDLTAEDTTGIDKMIWDLTIAKLDPFETNQVVEVIKAKTGTPKGVVADAMNARHKDLTKGSETNRLDSESRVIDYFLKAEYEAGRTIKRFGRMYWTYDSGLWAIDDEERIDGQFSDMLTEVREKRPQDFPELVMAVDDKQTSSWLTSIQKMLRGRLARRESKRDPMQLMRTFPLPVINTLNCELWFDRNGSFEVKKHNAENFFTMQIDCKYKTKAKCPEWDRFCALIFANSSDPEDMQRHLEELCGYVLGTARWLKTWVLFHGPKDTGKSTVAEVLKRMLGAGSFLGEDLADLTKSSSPFKNSKLIGKLVLVDDDYSKKNSLPDGFLKKISEEKSMTAELKYGSTTFEFVCRALPIICSNHWPKVSDLTDALRDRALVFPFHHKIAGSDRDDTRRNLMLDEMPGMLNRFVAGLSRLRERGDWDIPMDCADAREEWVENSNLVGMFKRMFLERSDTDLKPMDAWTEFEPWAKVAVGRGHQSNMPGQYGFYTSLDGLLGARIPIGGNQRAYRGWRLKSDKPAHPRVAEMDDVDTWDIDD